MTVARGFTRIKAPRIIPSSSPSPRVVRASQTEVSERRMQAVHPQEERVIEHQDWNEANEQNDERCQ